MDAVYIMSLLSMILSVVTATILIADFMSWTFSSRDDIKRLESRLERIEDSLDRSKR